MTTGLRTQRTIDAAVALGCWVTGLGLLLVLPVAARSDAELADALVATGSSTWNLTAAALTLQAGALLGVRVAPRMVLLSVTALAVALSVTAPNAIFDLTSLAVVVAVFRVVPARPGRDLLILLPTTVFLVAAGQLINDFAGAGIGGLIAEAVLQGTVVVGLPAVLAFAISARRDAEIARRNELDALARERDALVRAAVVDERTAMARELHDIAAHHLSGIILMAGAADRQIDVDPQTAHRSVRLLRAQAAAVLDDLRQLVGLLRQNTGAAERSVETLATVPSIIQDRRAAGVDVELQTCPAADGVPPGRGIGPLAQLVVYRMVQESLSNAAAHAPGAPCLVQIDDRDANVLAVTVINEALPVAPARRPGGFGLLGMQERAAVVGAELQYGRSADGCWRVRLTIPRDTAATVTGSDPSEQN